MKENDRCPMCTRRFEDRTDLRVHLMCEHRKSAITDELLAAVGAKHDRPRGRREVHRSA